MSDCIFCRENRFYNNFKAGFTYSESLLYENEYIFVTPDLSPLIPGHLLIVSQNHYNSFAGSPIEVRNALQKSIKHIHKNLNYKNITWFEHGAVFPGKGGASIDHAHLHILPYNFPIQQAIEDDNKYLKKLAFSQNEFCKLAGKQPYLWVGNGFSSCIYYVDNLPSQYLRNIVMRLQGSENYNWKSSFMEEASKKKYQETLRMIYHKSD